MKYETDIRPLFVAASALADHDGIRDLLARSRLRRSVLRRAPEALEADAAIAEIGAPVRATMIDWLMAQWEADTVLPTPGAEMRCISPRAIVRSMAPVRPEHYQTAAAWEEDWADGCPVRIPVLSAETVRAALAGRVDLSARGLQLMEMAGLHPPPIVGDILAITDRMLSGPAHP